METAKANFSCERNVMELCIGNSQYFGHLMRRANSLEKTLMLGKTLETPLDYKEIQPIHSKGNQC